MQTTTRLVGSIANTMMTMTQFIAVCIVLAVGLMMMKRTLNVPEYIATPAPAGLRQWIVDTGSEQDLVDTERAVTLPKRINPALTPINLSTANGSICADKIADFSIDQLNEVVTPYVLPSTPAVLSVGQRCLEKGYDSYGERTVLRTLCDLMARR